MLRRPRTAVSRSSLWLRERRKHLEDLGSRVRTLRLMDDADTIPIAARFQIEGAGKAQTLRRLRGIRVGTPVVDQAAHDTAPLILGELLASRFDEPLSLETLAVCITRLNNQRRLEFARKARQAIVEVGEDDAEACHVGVEAASCAHRLSCDVDAAARALLVGDPENGRLLLRDVDVTMDAAAILGVVRPYKRKVGAVGSIAFKCCVSSPTLSMVA